MVFINDRKYACATCIKGHRSSACLHGTRALFEIKRKGRPQTQCTVCRERRKKDRSHVRCNCAGKPEGGEGEGEGEAMMYAGGVEDIKSGKWVMAPYPVPPRRKRVLNPCDCGDDCSCSAPPGQKGKGKKPRLASASPSPKPVALVKSPERDAPEILPSSPESEEPVVSEAEEEGAEVVDFCCGPGCSCRAHAMHSGRETPGPSTEDARRRPEPDVCVDIVRDASPSPMDPSPSAGILPAPHYRRSTPPATSPRPSSSTPVPQRITLPSIHSFPWSSPLPPPATLAPPSPALVLVRTIGIARCACGWTCLCPGCNEHSPMTAVYVQQACPGFCTTCLASAEGGAGTYQEGAPDIRSTGGRTHDSSAIPRGQGYPAPAPIRNLLGGSRVSVQALCAHEDG